MLSKKNAAVDEGWNYGKIRAQEEASKVKVRFPKDRSKFKSMNQRDYEKRRAEIIDDVYRNIDKVTERLKEQK